MATKFKISFSQLWAQIDFTKLSTLSLIFSNLLVIVFAAVDRISALEVLWIYWGQSVIIGIFNFIKILTLKDFSTEGFRQGGNLVLPTKKAKISTAFFFLFHYGFFHFIYFVFLGSFSAINPAISTGFELKYFLYSTGMFFISYLVEFIYSKKEEADEKPNLGKVMFAPYVRIIPMHLTIILGGFISAAGSIFSADTNISIITLFIGIKTVIDLITHSISFNSLKRQLISQKH